LTCACHLAVFAVCSWERLWCYLELYFVPKMRWKGTKLEVLAQIRDW